MQSNSFITFPFTSDIWKIIPHPDKTWLVIELRNHPQRTVNYAVVDYVQHELLWMDNRSGDDWWRGVETVSDNYLILHGYRDLQNPEHLGIYVMDLATGSLLVEYPLYIFYGISNHTIYALERSGDDLLHKELNIKTGVVSEVSGFDFATTVPQMNIMQPIVVAHEDKAFARINSFVQRYVVAQVLAVEYLEFHNHIFISLFEQVDSLVQNRLMCIDATGELLFLETLNQGLKGVAPGSFFVCQEVLVFTKDSKELVYYPL